MYEIREPSKDISVKLKKKKRSLSFISSKPEGSHLLQARKFEIQSLSKKNIVENHIKPRFHNIKISHAPPPLDPGHSEGEDLESLEKPISKHGPRRNKKALVELPSKYTCYIRVKHQNIL